MAEEFVYCLGYIEYLQYHYGPDGVKLNRISQTVLSQCRF